MIYTVLLENGTIGTIDDSITDGQNPINFDEITVHLHDENGNPKEEIGKPIEILSESEY